MNSKITYPANTETINTPANHNHSEKVIAHPGSSVPIIGGLLPLLHGLTLTALVQVKPEIIDGRSPLLTTHGIATPTYQMPPIPTVTVSPHDSPPKPTWFH